MANKKEVKKKVSKKAAPAVEIENTLEKVENSITSKVVQLLAPEMKKSIEVKFEEMKTIFTNELKDIRSHMEAAPAVVESTTMPVNESGLTQPQAQEKAGLDSLLPIMQMLGMTGGQQNQGGLNNMFMEAIMRKSLADITRGDMMNEMMSKAMYKKLSGGEDMPDGITETTDSLMNPLRKYGENAKKS